MLELQMRPRFQRRLTLGGDPIAYALVFPARSSVSQDTALSRLEDGCDSRTRYHFGKVEGH